MRVGDTDVVVTPKVSIARLLFLLGYAANPRFRPEDVAATPEEDLWPAVAETLCRHAERALGPGVLQGYVTEDAALPLVRGRIRVADQIARHPGMLLPAEVRYDEYSVDTAENQILRSALRRMLDVPRVRPETAARLRHLDGRLEGARPLLPGARRGRYPVEEYYQVLAYYNALRVPVAWLVYASGAQGSVTRRVCNTDIELVEYPLRLDEPPSSLLAQIADLAQAAWQRNLDRRSTRSANG